MDAMFSHGERTNQVQSLRGVREHRAKRPLNIILAPK
jgi:hypothetical protein